MANILIIDDEEKLRALLKRIIALEGYKVCDVATLAAGRSILSKQHFDIVLCDVKLPDGNGVDFTKEVKEKHPDAAIVLLTAYGNIPDGVRAIKNGAFDYLVKGDDNDKIIPLLSRAAEYAASTQATLHHETATIKYGFESIIGNCAALLDAVQLAKRVAPTDAAVLLTGQTGTGKEVFAQAIHNGSTYARHAFVALNCATFSKDLMESELFGHKAGAFTGAARDKKGLVEEAKDGTLFLDEIGELPMSLQPKLLRLLENGTYIRVGDTKEQKTSLRIIAATNRDLQQEIAEGRFRSDLYYRIAVFTIELPSLAERVEDIPLLATYFLDKYAAKAHKNVHQLSKEALEALKRQEWKGNVRELKNVMERAVILEDTETIQLKNLPVAFQHCTAKHNPLHLATIEQQHIQKVLAHTKGNKAEAARLLDIGVATLYRKLDEYGLK